MALKLQKQLRISETRSKSIEKLLRKRGNVEKQANRSFGAFSTVLLRRALPECRVFPREVPARDMQQRGTFRGRGPCPLPPGQMAEFCHVSEGWTWPGCVWHSESLPFVFVGCSRVLKAVLKEFPNTVDQSKLLSTILLDITSWLSLSSSGLKWLENNALHSYILEKFQLNTYLESRPPTHTSRYNTQIVYLRATLHHGP